MRSVETQAAEVIVMFEESVIAVRHLQAGERFRVGGEEDVDLAWPTGHKLDLVRLSPAGAIEICAPRDLPNLVVELLDDASRPVLEAVHFVDEVDTGLRVTTVPAARRARVTLDQVSLIVAMAEAPVKRDLPPPIDLRIHRATAAMALAMLLGLLAINAIPPSPASLAIDPMALQMRGVRMRFQPPVEEQQPSAPGSAAAPAPATARKAEVPRFVRIAGAMGQSRTSRAKTVTERKEEAEDAASSSGMLGTIRSFEGSHTGAVFGPGSAFGSAQAAMGEIGGTENGEEAGSLAIDRLGARTGGSVDTVGKWGKIGRSGDGPGGDGPGGNCKSCKLAKHETKMISDFKIPAPDVHGPIDKEVIRRAVRSQSQAFKFCYEKELQHNADLGGRVVTKFTIAPNGQIVTALTASSTMNDPRVDACVADVFKRIQLPAMPANMGVSIVTYPLAFSSAAQRGL